MTKLVDQSGSLIASLPRFQSKTAVRFDRESNVGSLDVPVAFFFFRVVLLKGLAENTAGVGTCPTVGDCGHHSVLVTCLFLSLYVFMWH